MPTTVQEVRPSVCPLDCPDTCSLSVTVESGHIVDVRGSTANPYTAGVICEKVAKYYPGVIHGARRLTRPLLRTGPRGTGEFEPIGWDEAIDRVHQGLSRAIEEAGPESVLPFNYAGPHGQLAVGSMDRRFFHKLGASLLDRGPLCGAVRNTAYTSLFGASPGMPPEYAAHADVIAVWGNNVTVSNLHFARSVKAAREQGAKLIVIDPKRIRIAEQAHLFIQPRPGTDVVLALALANDMDQRGAIDRKFVDRWVFGFDEFMERARAYSLVDAAEICGVPLEKIEQMAVIYANADRLALSIGNGIERGRSGGSGLRAIMSLSVILGQLGRKGAGVIAKPGFAVPGTANKLQRTDFIPQGTRTINIVDVGRLLLDESLSPPIKALFIYNHNPVATHPDQNRMREGLCRDDLFVVGSDVVMTDSMAYADVVLPAASHFECDDLYAAYGHSYLQRAEPVLPAVGKSLPNTEIFRRLAARFGFDDPAFRASDAELMDDAVDATDARLEGHRPSEIPTHTAIMMKSRNGEEVHMCSTVFPATPSGRIELLSPDLQARFGYGLPRYEPVPRSFPLVLISPSSSKRTNSTFGGDDASRGAERVEIHPADAKRRSIAEGDKVKLTNELGEAMLIATISDKVREGVLYTPKGTWLETSATGQTVNALVPADLRTDIVDGACWNETFVEIARF